MALLAIFVASYTDSIYTLSFDPVPLTGSPTLNLLAQTIIGHHPSWITSHWKLLLGHNCNPSDINIHPLHTLTTPMAAFDAV
ncbi:hypothetical protein BDR06DRAFT_1008702 [Suillus hirtellus]|nr:hypothetical protein BDR06DRAFT_1008702 [Suillus hirtellus]